MKKIFVIYALIILTFTSCYAQKQNRSVIWYEFVSKDNTFKITFPEKPQESVKEMGEGNLKNQSYWLSVSQPLKTYMLTYADYPNAPIMSQNQLKENYNNLRDSVVKQSNAKLITEREIWLNGRFGTEFVFVDSKNITTKYRAYLIDKRFFQIITSIEAKAMESEETLNEADKFLNSFQVIEK